MVFLGQGSDSSLSCNNTGSLIHFVGLGIEPASQRSRDATDPVVPQRELLLLGFLLPFLPQRTLFPGSGSLTLSTGLAILGAPAFQLCLSGFLRSSLQALPARSDTTVFPKTMRDAEVQVWRGWRYRGQVVKEGRAWREAGL